MLSAFVLMITERGHGKRVLEALKKLDGVREAYMTYGVYDVMAKTKADTMDKLKEISRHVQKLDNVRSVQTMIVRAEKEQLCARATSPAGRAGPMPTSRVWLTPTTAT